MPSPQTPELRAARRALLMDTAGIAVSVAGFGVVYGVAARNAGFSPLETMSMSLLPFAGAAQFAAVGYVAQGLGWGVIVALTALLNSRHLLYSASLAPRLRPLPTSQRMAMAYVLTDETFALSSRHFGRLGRTDAPGYWIAGLLGVYLPWNLGTIVGLVAGGAIAHPSNFGLDVVFPAAMGGLAVGLVTGRREVVAAAAGAVLGVAVSLAAGTGVGVVAGGLLGPLVAFLVPERGERSGDEIGEMGGGLGGPPGGDLSGGAAT